MDFIVVGAPVQVTLGWKTRRLTYLVRVKGSYGGAVLLGVGGRM